MCFVSVLALILYEADLIVCVGCSHRTNLFSEWERIESMSHGISFNVVRLHRFSFARHACDSIRFCAIQRRGVLCASTGMYRSLLLLIRAISDF